jgi:hypothetical protein
LRHPLGLRAGRDDRDHVERQGEHPELRLDASVVRASGDLVLCCALASEERVARRAGARTALVGLGARLPLPEGSLVSFGVAGALIAGLPPGTLLTASRVVNEEGEVLWEGDPLGAPGARAAVLCDVGRIVDEPAERAEVAAQTGAEAIDMESATLAASRRLVGVIRAVIDTPEERVGRLAFAAKPDGRPDWPAVARALALEPVTSLRVVLRARRAFRSLGPAANALASK